MRLGRSGESLKEVLERRKYDTAIIALVLDVDYLYTLVNRVIDLLLERGVLDVDPREEEETVELEVTDEGGIAIADRLPGGAESDGTGAGGAGGAEANAAAPRGARMQPGEVSRRADGGITLAGEGGVRGGEEEDKGVAEKGD